MHSHWLRLGPQMMPIILFTLASGHLADNRSRKQIILAMTLLTCVSSIGLTIVSALQAPVAYIYACLLLPGTARSFLWPAELGGQERSETVPNRVK